MYSIFPFYTGICTQKAPPKFRRGFIYKVFFNYALYSMLAFCVPLAFTNAPTNTVARLL
jgi:hypothetical protein